MKSKREKSQGVELKKILVTAPIVMEPFHLSSPELQVTISTVDTQLLSKRVVSALSDGKVVPVLWENGDKLNLHLINYDLDYSAKQINEKSSLTIEVDARLLPTVTSVTLVSPDGGEPVALAFSVSDEYITFTVPALHVWDIVVIE